jgi:predicted choloylglycine hydrolase
MLKITLVGNPYERGLKQGSVFSKELISLSKEYPTWLGDVSTDLVDKIRNKMVDYLDKNFPEMISELKGISEGSGLHFDLICTINFVSAISALNGCTNLVILSTEAGPLLAKTSDIGNDFKYYSIQKVIPTDGQQYLAISWAGSLWAEVGINSSGLVAGQSSGPTQKGQSGFGIPTLQYPRFILEKCTSVEDAIEFCKITPMAGKGLSIALVDKFGKSAIVEKSGTAFAVRFPAQQVDKNRNGSSTNGVFCTNIFLEKEMQGFGELSLAGVPSLEENSKLRLENVNSFLTDNPKPSIQKIEKLLFTPLQQGGLCQLKYEPLITHYAYVLSPIKNKMSIYEGIPQKQLTRKDYFI